ncbi:MAG: LptE family protein [Chlamydiae bacterium]|nr:LptE family protein [Chlamydiota bacterium]MBI3265884.1 LptE family protein [Chlamydiota bacterium]
MKKSFCWILLLALAFSGCGYRVGSILPTHTKAIAVPTFQNKTQEPGVEMGITNQIINQFQIDGTLQVVEEEDADLKLDGAIIEYRREPLRFAGQDFKQVTEYRLRLITHLTLIDLKTGEPLWKDRVVEGETTYFVSGSFRESERTALGALTSQERSGLPTLEEDLAHDVVESVVEGW